MCQRRAVPDCTRRGKRAPAFPMPPTSYQLLIELRAPVRCTVGRLGTFDFPAGRYVYTGSARRAFEARIGRHLAGAVKRHWHIDYLLAVPGAWVVEVVRSRRAECALNGATEVIAIVPGFGSSDCRAGCDAHLKFQGAVACGAAGGRCRGPGSAPVRAGG
jgi:Uri superfamily endonuclease